MAKDLIFGRTRRNWSRGGCAAPISDEVTLRLTEPEMAMLADIASAKALADMGDRVAQKKMSGVKKKLKGIQKSARRGDPKARRSLLVLEESGVFRGIQTFSLGAFVGDDRSLVPNVSYRAAVLRQARKVGGVRPTTKDFFAAKKAVDGAMASAGLSLYLPGARPGRVTAGVPR